MTQFPWDWDNINSLGGEFGRNSNLVIDDLSETRVVGHADLDSTHHQPGGQIHGGLYATIVETVASVGASYAVREQHMYSVGVHNGTDFLRPFAKGRVEVTAEALFQGRTQQLWDVVITAQETGKVLARGQLRLANLSFPQ